MPEQPLPGYETFADKFVLGGSSTDVMASAKRYLDLGTAAESGARLMRSLNSSGFVGEEGDKYRDKLDMSLPDKLIKTADAHNTVGHSLSGYSGTLGGEEAIIAPLRAAAPAAHARVQLAVAWVNRAEATLAAAQIKLGQAEATHTAAVAATAATAGAAAPAEAAALTDLTASASAVTVAQADLSAARTELFSARTAWEGMVHSADGVQTRMDTAAQRVRDVINGEAGKPFTENPGWLESKWNSAKDWVSEHADLLKALSDILVTVGGLVAMLPGLGTVIGGIMIGIGLGIALVLTLNGNMSWGEFGMSAIGAIPGVGKGAKLAKEGVELAGKQAAKEGAETAGRNAARQGESVAGREADNCAKIGEPVDIATGAMIDDWVDLTIGGTLPLVIERHARSQLRCGKAFGRSWASILDCRVEIDSDAVFLVAADGALVKYAHPDGADEVLPEHGRKPMTFTDGAYRVRDVGAGITYEFALFGENSSVSSAAVVPDTSLAGTADTAVVVGLSAIVHHTGHRIELDYDQTTGHVAALRHSGGSIVEVDTDPVLGRVLALTVRDHDGTLSPVVQYEYSIDGDLVAVIDSSGQPFRYAYDGEHRITSWTDRNDVSYHYRYDHLGRVIAQAGTAGMFANAYVYLPDRGSDAPFGGKTAVMIETVTTLDPDIAGDAGIESRMDRLESLPLVAALRNGGLEAAGLAGPGRAGALDERIDANPWAAQSDPAFLQDDVLGEIRPWTYRSTAGGDLWRIVSAEGVVTEFERDDAHELVSWTRGDGSRIGYERDEYGSVVATQLPDGGEVRTEFGGLGVPVRQIDAVGRETEIEVDAVGNIVVVTDPAGAVTEYEYDVRATGSVPTKMTSPDGLVTQIECDLAGRPLRVIEPGGRAWSYERNVFGDVTQFMDPDGNTTTQTWTVDGRLLSRANADGSTQSFEYDAEGNQLTATDEVGHRTRTEYTVFNLPSARVDAAGGRLSITYDSTLEQRTVTSPDGLDWTFELDRDARVVAETDYNGARTAYRLDGLKRPVQVTNALGRNTFREFDLMGRIVGERSDDGATVFAYDAAGDLTEAANADAVVTFERDLLGRVTAETVNGVRVESSFDRSGRRTQRTVRDENGRVWSTPFRFDDAGMLGSIGDDQTSLAFDYDNVGRESARSMGRARMRQRYDSRHRLVLQDVATTSTRVNGTAPVVAGRAWSYRQDGYVAGLSDAVRGDRRFVLDELGRVTSVRGGINSRSRDNANAVESYAYSPSGILTAADSEQVAPTSGVASSPVTGVARIGNEDRVGSQGTLITRVGRTRYVYDDAGQMIQSVTTRLSRKPAVTTYDYSAAGQIRAAHVPDGTTWTYGYDAFGRRVSKVHTTADGTVLDIVEFGWDADDLVFQCNTAKTSRAGLDAGASSTWVWTYHPGTGEPVSQHIEHSTPDGSANEWSQAAVDAEFHAIVCDLAGAPTELIDPARGEVDGRSMTSLWGRTRWAGEVDTPLRFAGQQFDAETGLHYNRFRYYNPVTTTYTSPDPLGISPNPTSSTAYVHNPTTWVDPLGLHPKDQKGTKPYKASGRPPHEATASIERNGEIVHRQQFRSGNMTPEEKALGFPKSVQATHTENRAMRQLDMQSGDKVTLDGQYSPCSTCKGAMNGAVRDKGVSVQYNWPEGTWNAGG